MICTRNTIDRSADRTLVFSLIHSRVDCCNSLYDLHSSQTNVMQLVLHAVACVVTETLQTHDTSSILKSLQRLKVNQMIQFKLIGLSYIKHFNLVILLIFIRSCISSTLGQFVNNLLSNLVAFSICFVSKSLVARSFYHTALALWNFLTAKLRKISHKRSLTTFYVASSPIVLSREMWSL